MQKGNVNVKLANGIPPIIMEFSDVELKRKFLPLLIAFGSFCFHLTGPYVFQVPIFCYGSPTLEVLTL